MSCPTDCSDSRAGHLRIEDRLLPLPRSVRCDGWWDVRPDELQVVAESDDDTIRLAAEEMGAFLTEQSASPIPVRVGQGSAPRGALRLVLAQSDDDAIPATGYQPYAIVPEERGLRLVGKEAVGVYYGVKTLQQALGFEAGRVRVPQLHVADSADLAERGFWDYFYPAPVREASEMHTLRTAAQWHTFIDDLTDYKINLLELLIWGGGLYYNSTRYPELVRPGTPEGKNDLVRDVIAYARRRGCRVFLQCCHPEQFGMLMAAHPELAAVNPTGVQPSLQAKMFCFSHPRTRQVLAGIFEEVAELFEPDGITVWLPENLGRCTCEACARQGYLPQAFSIHREAFARARQRQPRLQMRCLVSFLRYSDAVLRMVPEEAQLLYYECDRHGMYGFDDDKRLPARLAAAARQDGRRIVGCMSYRGSGQRYVPLPCLENVAEWVRLFVTQGYYGVNGSMYSNPGVCRLNILRMADVAWNARGRGTDGFLRAYCTRHGQSQPIFRATALRMLSDGWEVYHRKQGGVMMERHALDCLLTRRGPNTVDAFYITDALEYRDLPAMRHALANLEVGADVARKLDDDDLGRQFQVCQIRLGAMCHILAALHVHGRQQWPDPEKGPWSEWIEEIERHLKEAQRLLGELPEVTSQIGSRWPGVQGDPAVTDEPTLERIAEALAPEFLQDLAKHAWPSL